eukprot:5299921-Alexandrium_andersonii.AAC.1
MNHANKGCDSQHRGAQKLASTWSKMATGEELRGADRRDRAQAFVLPIAAALLDQGIEHLEQLESVQFGDLAL